MDEDDYVNRLLDKIEAMSEKQEVLGSKIGHRRISRNDSDLASLIADIHSATEITENKSSIVSSTNSSKETKQKRCSQTFLGGSSVDVGLNTTTTTSIQPRACESLRCVNCDFTICQFDDQAWKANTDYLFMRNHMPDIIKLKQRLISRKGCRAYACQCSWRNIEGLMDIKSDSTLKWICGKH